MKMIQDSGVSHWIHTRKITCEQCGSIYQTETNKDFKEGIGLDKGSVETVCPRDGCGFTNRTHRTLKITPSPSINPYPKPETVPWNPSVPRIIYYNVETKTGNDYNTMLNWLDEQHIKGSKKAHAPIIRTGSS